MPDHTSLPRRIQAEASRREEWVRTVVVLHRGQLEDLELLVRHRSPKASRSEIVREAIMWLQARRAMEIVRSRDIEQRHAERRAREAEAISFSRQERDGRDQKHELEHALALIDAVRGDVDA